MGLNFLDHPPLRPRTIFVESEEAPVAKTAPAATLPPQQTFTVSDVGVVLFRTLKRFPEAYRAVVEALRQLSPELAPTGAGG